MDNEFIIGKVGFSVTDDVLKIAKYKINYMNLADIMVKEYKSVFDAQVKEFNNSYSSNKFNLFLSNLLAICDTTIEELSKECARRLTELEIYDIDKKTIVNYCKQLKVTQSYESIIRDYQGYYKQIEENRVSNLQMNEYNKQMRDRVVGGGFGLGGYLKGAATAGALNAASGAAYSVKNSIAESNINNQADSLIKELVNDKDFCEVITMAYRSIVMDMWYIDYSIIEGMSFQDVSNYRNLEIEGLEDKSELLRLDKMFNNIKDLMLAEDKEIDLLSEIISKNPFESKYYEYCIEKWSDRDNHIQDVAKTFGVHLEFYKLNQIKNKTCFDELKAQGSFKTMKYNQFAEEYEKFRKCIEFYGLSYADSVYSDLNKSIKRFNDSCVDTRKGIEKLDKKYSFDDESDEEFVYEKYGLSKETNMPIDVKLIENDYSYDGWIYADKEAKEEAKKQDLELKSKYEKCLEKNECIKLQDNIKNGSFLFQLKRKYIDMIKEKIDDIDDQTLCKMLDKAGTIDEVDEVNNLLKSDEYSKIIKDKYSILVKLKRDVIETRLECKKFKQCGYDEIEKFILFLIEKKDKWNDNFHYQYYYAEEKKKLDDILTQTQTRRKNLIFEKVSAKVERINDVLCSSSFKSLFDVWSKPLPTIGRSKEDKNGNKDTSYMNMMEENVVCYDNLSFTTERIFFKHLLSTGKVSYDKIDKIVITKKLLNFECCISCIDGTTEKGKIKADKTNVTELEKLLNDILAIFKL